MNLRHLGKAFGVLVLAAVAVATGYSVVSADSGPNHQAVQARPISLGTSGGNIADISTLYCCSGTLGSLVEDGAGNQYILSNNHVLARSNLGTVGDPVNQPGMVDQNCQQNGVIANLSAFVPLQMATRTSTPLNQCDAAIAQVISGDVRTDGSILDIGTVNASPMTAFVNQSVKKSGRTTGLTTGTVTAVDVTVDVGYSTSCGGPSKQKARFVNQINITPGTFSAGGDSGSLIVENVASSPRAVGLLFAGSSSSTIANPIAPVLSLLGVSMVGGAPVPPSVGSVSGVVRSAGDNSVIAGATVSADTGQVTTTDAGGGYTLTSVPTGTRSISASATGFLTASQSVSVSQNATSTADFSLSVAVAPTSVGVGCVTYTSTRGNHDLTITVRALDNFGNPVAGAQVNIAVTLNGSAYGTGTGATTNANGQASYTSRNAPNGTYATTVTDITASGLTFDSGSTPFNSFRKGTDSSPASFCNSGATPSDATEGPDARLSRARAAKARNSEKLFRVPGVQGHGVGFDEEDNPVIEVYLDKENAASRAQIPATVENVPVRVVVTGEFKAY